MKLNEISPSIHSASPKIALSISDYICHNNRFPFGLALDFPSKIFLDVLFWPVAYELHQKAHKLAKEFPKNVNKVSADGL